MPTTLNGWPTLNVCDEHLLEEVNHVALGDWDGDGDVDIFFGSTARDGTCTDAVYLQNHHPSACAPSCNAASGQTYSGWRPASRACGHTLLVNGLWPNGTFPSFTQASSSAIVARLDTELVYPGATGAAWGDIDLDGCALRHPPVPPT